MKLTNLFKEIDNYPQGIPLKAFESYFFEGLTYLDSEDIDLKKKCFVIYYLLHVLGHLLDEDTVTSLQSLSKTCEKKYLAKAVDGYIDLSIAEDTVESLLIIDFGDYLSLVFSISKK